MNINLTDREQQVLQAAALFFFGWKTGKTASSFSLEAGKMNDYDILSTPHTIAALTTAIQKLDPQHWQQHLQNPHPSQIATLQPQEPVQATSIENTSPALCSCNHYAKDHTHGNCDLCSCQQFNQTPIQL